MAITGLAHTSFTIVDMDAALAFWTGPLGFELWSRDPWKSEELRRSVGLPGVEMDIAILKGHGYEIELIACGTTAGAALDVEANRPGASHLALLCDDIEATAQDLVAAGAALQGQIAWIADDPKQAGWAVYLRDPNGIILELIQPPA